LEKLLTVAVPAYNAQATLEKCLNSFVCAPEDMARLEVITVNDGSADGTLDIAREFARRWPGTFGFIDKPNGGHGSGINAAAAAAAGRYFKVVDADDWVVTENLPALLGALARTEADAVLTHYHTVHMQTGARVPFRTAGVALGRPCTLDDLMAAGSPALICCTFHGLCYRTAFYRGCGHRLSEGVFYEDQEYATIPLAQAAGVLPLDLFFYEYMIGNASQSVSDQNQVKRIGQLEQVYGALDARFRRGGLTPAGRSYFLYKLKESAMGYYTTMLLKNPDRRGGRAAARAMRRRIAAENPDLAALTRRPYAIILLLHDLGASGRTLDALRASPLYLRLRAMMH